MSNPEIVLKNPTSESPKGPERRKHMNKKALVARVAGALFVAANAGMGVKHHYDFGVPNTPAGIVSDIKYIPYEWLYTFEQLKINNAISDELNRPISPEFDNRIDDAQLVQAGINTTAISEEEISSLLKDTIGPVIKGEFPKPTILLPFKLTDGEKIDIKTYWTNSFNSLHPGSNAPIASGKIFTIGQKGTEIIIPVEGAKVYIGTSIVNNKRYLSGYGIFFNGPDGTEYDLGLTTEDIRLLQPTDLIEKAISDGKNNFDLSVNTSIATTSANNVIVQLTLYAYPPGYPKDKVGLPCNYNLVEKDVNGKTVLAFVPQPTQVNP